MDKAQEVLAKMIAQVKREKELEKKGIIDSVDNNGAQLNMLEDITAGNNSAKTSKKKVSTSGKKKENKKKTPNSNLNTVLKGNEVIVQNDFLEFRLEFKDLIIEPPHIIFVLPAPLQFRFKHSLTFTIFGTTKDKNTAQIQCEFVMNFTHKNSIYIIFKTIGDE